MKEVEQLKVLYSISKLLSTFEGIEKSFPAILGFVADTFPLRTAVLIENWEQKPNTVVWHSSEAKNEQILRATANARNEFSYLTGATISESDEIHQENATTSELSKSTRNDDHSGH